MITQKLCECGCGEFVKKGNRFVKGHHKRSKIYWEKQKGPQLCKCRCGDYAKPGRLFIQGHNGRVCSEETRAKLSKASTGRKHTKEAKEKISLANKGKVPWTTGRTVPEKTKHKISKANKGRTHTEKSKTNMSIGHIRPRNDGYCDAWGDTEYINDLRAGGCKHCGMPNMMSIHLFGIQLHTHHKNGKKCCSPKDIITLCLSCHMKLHGELRQMK